jgi:H+/Cl- antiporter ClcA
MPMNLPGLSPAGQSLGLGSIPGLGTALSDQVGDLSEEERKKRMLQQQQQQLLGPGGSAASASLFGSPLAGIGGTGRLF